MKTAQDVFYKDLEVNFAAHRVSRAGHELCLTPREFALLAVLLTHCDKALSPASCWRPPGGTLTSARAAPWMYISTACAASWDWKMTSRPYIKWDIG